MNGIVRANNQGYASTYHLSVQASTTGSWIEVLNSTGTGQGAQIGVTGTDFEIHNDFTVPGNLNYYLGASKKWVMKSDGVFQIVDLASNALLKTDASGNIGNVTLAGNLTLTVDTLNTVQDITTGSSPTFTALSTDTINEKTGSAGVTITHELKPLQNITMASIKSMTFPDETKTDKIILNTGKTIGYDGTDILVTGDSKVSGDLEVTGDIIWDNTSQISGFLDKTAQTCTFTDGTRTFQISPTGSDFSFVIKGTKYTKSSTDSIIIGTTTGSYWIYYNSSGVLSQVYNPTYTQIASAINTGALVSNMYWNNSLTKGILFSGNNELHGVSMAYDTHRYEHFTNGFSYISGGALSNILVDQSGDLNTHAQFSIGSSIAYDEDMEVSLSAETSTSTIPVFYRTGVSPGTWTQGQVTNFKVLTTGTGRLAWNELTGGSWQLTEVTNNNFVLYHVYQSNNIIDSNYVIVMGQNKYNTISNARVGATTEANNLATTGFPTREMKIISSIIFQTSDGYGNTVKARIRSTDTGDDYIDWRTVDGIPSGSLNNHNLLSGLSDDDHVQYLLLSGRSGGQVAIGGTDAGDDITFQTTSNASKGSYIFSELSVSKLLATGSSSELSSVANLSSWIAGTTNEVTVTDDGDGSCTLSLPLTIKADKIQGSTLSTSFSIDKVTFTTTTSDITGISSSDTNNRIDINGGSGYSNLNIVRGATNKEAVIRFYTGIDTEWFFGLDDISNNLDLGFFGYDVADWVLRLKQSGGEIFMPQVYDDTVTGQPLYINSSGQLGQTSSLTAHKTNIEDISSISWIYNLSPKKFNYRKKDGPNSYSNTEFHPSLDYGLLAEEVSPVNDDLCNYINKKTHVKDCPDEHKSVQERCSCLCPSTKSLIGVSYIKLIAPIIKCIQDQKKEIDELKKRITTLENSI
jgi:phenolic acid decarboxylase